ncbi:10849_t:CDS:1 [Funneliformis geosporum]|uniref:10849_t:CDS:1 n=1 Tax=Funneliformis geosporum TaxID=1117311 RepID=A0A9W4T693_9GLOM|nr:10849_t:CDS:1 [Funneliformis geosporum]
MIIRDFDLRDYDEIFSDVNEFVIRGFLILFLFNSPNNWERPDVNVIVARLSQLIDLGFQLTSNDIENVLFLFEHRINEIGGLLMNSFQIIRKELKSDIARSCLIQTIKPGRNFKKTDLLEFLINLKKL